MDAWKHPFSRWPGDPVDPIAYMWSLGWSAHAIDTGTSPLHSDLLNYPRGFNAVWGGVLPLSGMLAWPAVRLGG